MRARGVNTVAASSGGDTVEVVTERRGETPVVTKEVPRNWYQHETKVNEGLAKLREGHRQNPDVLGVQIIPGGFTVGGKGRRTGADAVPRARQWCCFPAWRPSPEAGSPT
jgi:hypothetical protein